MSFKNFFVQLKVLGVLIILGYSHYLSASIYNEDNRIEEYEASEMERNTAKSVAGRFSKDHLISSGGNYIVKRNSIGQEKCSSNRFAEQMLGPSCSGFLIKSDVLVTAAHCMEIETKCSDNVWAFDYSLKNPTDKSYHIIPKEKVYQCKKIIIRKYASFGDIDYAIIQLDRPVQDRTPLELDLESKPELKAEVFMAGYPTGLPMKVTNKGYILKNDSPLAFDTDLDGFQGNSGSPVVDSRSGKVLGIRSHGHEDYIRDNHLGCKVPRVCRPEDHCYLSTISRVSNMIEDLIKIQNF